MSRQPISLAVPDTTQFARSISRQLLDLARPPSHLEMLNILARAAGFRNHQHLRASHAAGLRLAAGPVPHAAVPADLRLVERALRHFDAQGRLASWPARRAVQVLCLWALWSGLPATTPLPERAVNEALMRAHLFADPATLRRDMFALGLVTRNRDGSNYRRVNATPPPEARALIRQLRARQTPAHQIPARQTPVPQ
ncbi:MAG: DUF2087 domain-containing protein [Paracoccus sp. (in: a-proteobacteria)]|nr:DUF2087 domain-containing protein [Paracoccus sp. (in: a-proteobacteria)]